MSLRDVDGVAEQHALVAGAVGDQLDIGRDVAIALDQAADGGRQAGREAPGGEQSDFLFGHDRFSSRRDPLRGRMDGIADHS